MNDTQDSCMFEKKKFYCIKALIKKEVWKIPASSFNGGILSA